MKKNFQDNGDENKIQKQNNIQPKHFYKMFLQTV